MGPDDARGDDSVDSPAARRAGRVGAVLLVAAIALALDIVSKAIVVARLSEDESVRLAGGALYLVQARNDGAAFSIGSGASVTIVFTLVAAIVAVIIVRTARRLRSLWWAVSLGLILGGALGNLVDRLFRAPGVGRGYVVDWISVFADAGGRFPIFNLADSAITCGAVLAVVLSLLGVDFDGVRAGRSGGREGRESRRGAGGVADVGDVGDGAGG